MVGGISLILRGLRLLAERAVKRARSFSEGLYVIPPRVRDSSLHHVPPPYHPADLTRHTNRISDTRYHILMPLFLFFFLIIMLPFPSFLFSFLLLLIFSLSLSLTCNIPAVRGVHITFNYVLDVLAFWFLVFGFYVRKEVRICAYMTRRAIQNVLSCLGGNG